MRSRFVNTLQSLRSTTTQFIHQCLYVYLGHAISRLIGILAYQRRPQWLVQAFIKLYFIRMLKVNVAESTLPQLHHYKRTVDFFTRHIRAERRPIAPHPKSIVAPCDGTILNTGITQPAHTYRIKHQDYPLKALLGNQRTESNQQIVTEKFYNQFLGGHYILIYLSPRDCHRLYAPLNGDLIRVEHLEGALYPVRETFLGTPLDVFGRNRKLRLTFQTKTSYFVMIWVGAFNVGTFQTTFDPHFYTSSPDYPRFAPTSFFPDPDAYHYKTYDHRTFTKGDALGAFELGSSVLLFLSQGSGAFPSLTEYPSHSIQIGQAIGTLQ